MQVRKNIAAMLFQPGCERFFNFFVRFGFLERIHYRDRRCAGNEFGLLSTIGLAIGMIAGPSVLVIL
jgi:hypothetical protein